MFYWDDFCIWVKLFFVSFVELDFFVEGKNVILVDDVLYIGWIVQAVLMVFNYYGWLNKVELLVFVDCCFNWYLFIQGDYIGMMVDVVDKVFVCVEWKEQSNEDCVLIFVDKSEVEEQVNR